MKGVFIIPIIEFLVKKVSNSDIFFIFAVPLILTVFLKTYIMKTKKKDLIILHPLQINANRVRNLVNCVLDYLQDTDISPSHRLEVSIKDLTSCLDELEKLRVNLCDFRSELQYTLQVLNEEDLSF